MTLAMSGVFFFMSLYVQQILGYSAVQAGAIFLPMTLLIAFLAPVAGKAADRLGSRWLMSRGLGLLALSLLLFSRLGLGAGFSSLLPGLVLGGIGMAIVMTPMTTAAMGSVPAARAGVAGGVLNTFGQVGGTMSIAVTGAILTSQQSSALVAGARRPAAFLDGYQLALEVGAAVALLGAVAAAVLIRRIHPRAPAAGGRGDGSHEPAAGAGHRGGLTRHAGDGTGEPVLRQLDQDQDERGEPRGRQAAHEQHERPQRPPLGRREEAYVHALSFAGPAGVPSSP